MKIVFLITFISSFVFAETKVHFKKSWSIPASTKIATEKIGGLSGCVRDKDQIYFVSDDRGGAGGARILSFPWNEAKTELDIQNGKTLTIDNPDKSHILDLEGIGLDLNGHFLLSNEGDLNKKPRQPPEIFWVDATGKRQKSLKLDDKFIPEKSGQQTKGIQNNFGFEGLSVDHVVGKWGAFTEAPLMQITGNLFLIEGDLKSDEATAEYTYPVPMAAEDALSFALGVTDFLYRTPTELLVLERGVDISPQGMTFNVQLCKSTKQEKNQLTRECFYQFANDPELMKQIKATANFEGLCWLNEKKTQFLVVSDNNFSKNENTLFLLYQVD